MRGSLVCLAAVLSTPVGASGVADEMVLLQQGSRQEPEYKLNCDYLHGCSYNVATSTPAPFQLVCDKSNGCYYTGVTPPPTAPPQRLPGPDLTKVVNMLTHPPQLPDLSQLSNLVKPLLPALQKMPVISPQTSSSVTATGPVAHFMPDNKMVCVEAPADYLRAAVLNLKASPLGDGYLSAEVAEGTCAGQSYDKGPIPEGCFPKASLWMNPSSHTLDVLSEPKLMAGYAAKNGAAALAKGMTELCKL